MKKLGILALAVLCAAAAFVMYRYHDVGTDHIVVKLAPGPPQPRVPPGEAGIDPAAINLAVEYADKRHTSALVIGRGGHIVFEKYWGDTTVDTRVTDSDFGAPFAALLVGSAMNDRLALSLDEPLSVYLPEYAGKATGMQTMRQLLGGQSTDGVPPTELAALVLERVTKQPFENLVTERLWKPMGGGELWFRRNDSNELRRGSAAAGCCVTASIGDWMRVGELLANDGVFEGSQFTPPRYVTLMLTPTHKGAGSGFGVNVDDRFAAHDVAWLSGARNQRLWVVPSLRLVILRVGDEPDASEGWDEAMIPDSIIRGTSGWHPKSVGEGVDPNKYAPH
jgi:CubicO group peptidase (beta-lactamase class C family)